MSSEKNPAYFSTEALARFVSAQNKIVEKVICHLWQNLHNASEAVEIIDNVELHFTDKQKLTISCNPDGDGLDAIDYNYKESAIQVQQEFGNKIKIFAIDASSTKMWEDVIGKTLEKVQLTKDNDYYKADALMLNFGEERREIAISPLDGLVIDYYED